MEIDFSKLHAAAYNGLQTQEQMSFRDEVVNQGMTIVDADDNPFLSAETPASGRDSALLDKLTDNFTDAARRAILPRYWRDSYALYRHTVDELNRLHGTADFAEASAVLMKELTAGCTAISQEDDPLAKKIAGLILDECMGLYGSML